MNAFDWELMYRETETRLPNHKSSVVSVNIQKSLIRQIELPKNSVSNGTGQIAFALYDNVCFFFSSCFLWIPVMSRMMEVRKKDYLLVLVLLVSQTKINSCLPWPRLLQLLPLTLEVLRVTNINFLPTISIVT